MKVEQTVNMSFTESLASTMAERMNKERDGEYIDYLKMKLGLEMLLINLAKIGLVYGVALTFHLMWQTLIMHGAYFAIRRTAFGLHANNSIICSILSLALFIGIPFLSQNYIMLDNYMVGILGFIFTALLYRYAPADTDKFPLLGKERREKLRRITVTACLIIVLIALVCPSPVVKSLLMLGVMSQVIMVLPITYKLLKRSYNNYENYEAKNV